MNIRLPVFTREIGLAGITLFTVLLVAILYPTSFANFANFSAIVRNLAFEGILAVGMMLMLAKPLYSAFKPRSGCCSG